MSVFPGDEEHNRGKSAILTSAVRSPMLHDAAPLAMHYLYSSVPYGSLLGSRADEPGSDVIYYSPAELSAELDVTVRLAFDRFNRETFDSWVDAAATAASLPVFAVSGPTGAAWIAVAQNAAKLVTRIADKAIDGDNDRVMTWRVNLSSPGRDLTKSGYVLLYPDGNELIPANPGKHADQVISTDGSFSRAGDQFEVRNGKLCWAGTDDVVLTGDSYVLVFINGAKIRELEGWAAAAVSANLAEKFLNADRVDADDAIAAFKLFNDVRWLREIGTIDRDAAALAKEKDSAEKTKKLKELETRRDAARKNIQDDSVRELYEKAAAADSSD
ncbi:hypothetical protein ACFUTX_12150 [Microbacterium sp. NPDC057407]|uniref:hypothetical protein n=1 Tax=Microbacterium sp. NPDC057407 TaxID=3346120 RepID=UPI00366C2612